MKAFFISYLLWQIALIVQVGADQNQDQEDPPGECVIDAQTGVCETNNPDNTVDNEPQAEQTLEDNHPKCMEWAKLGECFVNTSYMRHNCKKSCYEIHSKPTPSDNIYKPPPYFPYTPSPKCQLYMAESSIPNAGLGMYTAAPISKDQYVYHPDIIVNYFDFAANNEMANAQDSAEKYKELVGNKKNKSRSCDEWAMSGECESNPTYMLTSCALSCAARKTNLLDEAKEKAFWVPDDYYWDPVNTESLYEADEVSALVPGLGALANSHTGLKNCAMSRGRNDITGLHRSGDPGAGAFSSYYNLGFTANHDIPAGMELFVEYGDEWFSGREHKFGPLPLSYHFSDADKLVEEFWSVADGEDESLSEDLFNLTNELVTDIYLKMAMPKTLEQAKIAKTDGTAILSVPDVIRSSEWLEENGICLDHIRADLSTVDQAGRGAFATRDLNRGDVVAPLPLLHMDRKKLRIFEELEDEEVEEINEQLIVNYSFSHPLSTLLFFPYSPVVNFVNNNVDKNKVNARLRWSKHKFHTKDWEELTVDQILEQKRAGLLLEIVATRDIERDEEIFIDYGADWDKAWEDHVSSWEPPTGDYIPIHQINMEQDLRTRSEQLKDPYAENILIICHFASEAVEEAKSGEIELHWDDYSAEPETLRRTRPCQIMDRYESLDEETGNKMTFFNVKLVEGTIEFYMDGVPRRAIEIVDVEYTSDQHLKKGFRHPIYIPDEVFPEKWKNLKKNIVIDGGQTVIHKSENAHWEIEEEGASDKCKYFLAESTLEGAGVGLYAGIDLKPGDFTKKEIAIPAYDHTEQIELRCAKDPIFCEQNSDWLLGNYEWHATLTRTTYEAAESYIAVPGMGSLPNHNEGFMSAQAMLPKLAGAGLHRSKDPMAGSISLIEHQQFQITRELVAGMEIFISYGRGYFSERSIDQVPEFEDFIQADKIIKSFLRRVDINRTSEEDIDDLWDFERKEFVSSDVVLSMLPEDMEGIIMSASTGIAKYNALQERKSLEWLEQNGRCVDNIKVAASTIPEAGRGAIAKTSVKKGEIVTSSPMLQHKRDFMTLLTREEGDIKEKGKQLILNYMYGHPNSSLLLLPISPAVHAINHNTEEQVNTRIQWSSLPLHHSEWMNKTTDEVFDTFRSGLILDYVATKNIEKGDEIFIDYGPSFDSALKSHISNWKPVKDANAYLSSWHFTSSNDPVRTKDEQLYPENILVYCSIPMDSSTDTTKVATSFGDAFVWDEKGIDNFDAFEHAEPCDILDRSWDSERKSYFYTALVKSVENGEYLMTNIGKVYFADKAYSTDHFLENAFRHEIHVPEDLYPEVWMDL